MKFWQAMKALENGLAVKRMDLLEPLLPADIQGSEYEMDFSTEWELYSSPLTFTEIMQYVQEGDKFKRKEWPDELYFEMHGGLIFCQRRDLTPQDFLAKDYHFIRETVAE